MNDCSNAEIRDQLPDLVHERLDGASRTLVLAHVDGCVDCRDELQLLRDVQRAMAARTPRMDVAYIVGALPKAPARAPIPVTRRRPMWSDWRVAAAVTLLVAGGGSYAVTHSNNDIGGPSFGNAVAVAPTQAPIVEPPVAPSVPVKSNEVAQVPTVADATPVPEAASDVRLHDLSEAQLQSLLNDISNMKAVPATEPEPVTIPVDVKISGDGGDQGA
jgi:hypothetical protein